MQLTLDFPALVEPSKADGYRMCPLLAPGPVCTHARYERAALALRREVRRSLRDVSSEREDVERLLWYQFTDAVELEMMPIDLRIGSAWLLGHVALARYTLHGDSYLCLPKFDHLTCLCPPEPSRDQRHEIALSAARDYLSQREERDADTLRERHLSPAGTTQLRLDTSLQIERGPFDFELGSTAFFDALFSQRPRSGASELARSGVSLADAYPFELDTAPQREAQTRALAERLFAPVPRCIALIGPRGVGKSTLVQAAFAHHLGALDDEARRRAADIWHIDPSRVIAGMSVVGMWQRRFELMLEALRMRLKTRFNIDRADVLYVDNLMALMQVGRSAQNSLTLGDVLRPHMERRALPVLIEATPSEWDAAIERNRRFCDLFEVLRLDPPSAADAVRMLSHRRAQLEAGSKASFSAAAVVEVIRNARRDARGESLPGAAARVLERLAARHPGGSIGPDQVNADLGQAMRLSPMMRDTRRPQSHDDRLALLDARLVGQAPTKRALADVISVIRARLSDPGRPLASLLFTGPTGVGKTEAAKALAELLFSGGESLVRFDMNEFGDPDAAARLIGDAWAPDGQLTTRVRHRGACVLLFDEIEKAHPRIHDLLLQLLDDARLTDALGQLTDFSGCVVVLTSNLGAAQAGRRVGFHRSEEDAGATFLDAVRRFFRPELFNRLDQTVVFESLGRADARLLASRELERLLTRDGFVRRTVFVDVSSDTLDRIAVDGYDGALGARALKRALERHLVRQCAATLAAVAPEQPLVLRLRFDADQIDTQVIPLRFAASRSLRFDAPSPADLPEVFERRALEVAALRLRFDELLDSADDTRRLLLWSAKDRLTGLAGRIDDVAHDLAGWRSSRARHFSPAPASKLSSAWSWAGFRAAAGDLAARADLFEYFEEAAREAVRISELSDLYWLELDLEYRYLATLVAGHIANQRDAVVIRLTPMCADAQSRHSIDLLRRAYVGLLRHLDTDETDVLEDGDCAVIRCVGTALMGTLVSERGVHLFQSEDTAGVPIAVDVRRDEDAVATDGLPNEIVRIYRARAPMVTDLRSGLVCALWPSATDWMMLLHGARLCSREAP